MVFEPSDLKVVVHLQVQQLRRLGLKLVIQLLQADQILVVHFLVLLTICLRITELDLLGLQHAHDLAIHGTVDHVCFHLLGVCVWPGVAAASGEFFALEPPVDHRLMAFLKLYPNRAGRHQAVGSPLQVRKILHLLNADQRQRQFGLHRLCRPPPNYRRRVQAFGSDTFLV